MAVTTTTRQLHRLHALYLPQASLKTRYAVVYSIRQHSYHVTKHATPGQCPSTSTYNHALPSVTNQRALLNMMLKSLPKSHPAQY